MTTTATTQDTRQAVLDAADKLTALTGQLTAASRDWAPLADIYRLRREVTAAAQALAEACNADAEV